MLHNFFFIHSAKHCGECKNKLGSKIKLDVKPERNMEQELKN